MEGLLSLFFNLPLMDIIIPGIVLGCTALIVKIIFNRL